MGLMVAILPTHPRVSEVTCMRADAKRQEGLTGTHTQSFSEKYCPEKIASKKEYLYMGHMDQCVRSHFVSS